MKINSRKSARKSARKSSRKTSRKSVRKSSRKTSRKSARKSVRKSVRKSSRKTSRKPVRKAARKVTRPKYKDLSKERVTALMDILEEVEGKAIIWAHWRQDIDSIVKAIEKEYPGSVMTYYGGTSTEDRAKAIKAHIGLF